jgi:hypothetical protein
MRARTRLALIIGGLVLAVGIAELALRLAGKPLRTFERFTVVGMTGAITTEIAPIRAHPTRWWENDVEPDPRIAEPKPPGTRRIAVLGDSVMANITGTDIPARLEDLLRSQGDDVQVLNFSCLGYSTVQGLRWWREAVRATKPDLVVIAYDWNDLYTPPSIGVGATSQCSDVHWSRRVDWESTRIGLLLFDALTSPEPVLQRVPPTDSALTMRMLFDEIAATGAEGVWVTLPVGPRGPRDGNWSPPGMIRTAAPTTGKPRESRTTPAIDDRSESTTVESGV